MKFTWFLAISGACFLLSALLRYLDKPSAAWAVLVPGVVFLICGAVGMIHFFWTMRHPDTGANGGAQQ